MLSQEIISYINQYGYYAIFLLVFLQEVGAPNPLPNELLLLFAGVLCFSGALSFPLVILAAVVADLIGTSLLYFVSLAFGNSILRHRPKYIPLPYRLIERMKTNLSNKGLSGIFFGRLSPFIRGYMSVITGLLQVSPSRYYPIALVTSLIWSLFYVVIGYFLGPYWNKVLPHLLSFGEIMLFIFLLLVVTFTLKFIITRKYKSTLN
jgi:membrane protein DedA with SNARE-associated domain